MKTPRLSQTRITAIREASQAAQKALLELGDAMTKADLKGYKWNNQPISMAAELRWLQARVEKLSGTKAE